MSINLPSYIDDLTYRSDQAFNRGSLMTFRQMIAEWLFPHRSDFTQTLNLGKDLFANLITSMPVASFMELCTTVTNGMMPQDTRWVNIHGDTTLTYTKDELLFLEFMSNKLFYFLVDDKPSGFVNAWTATTWDSLAFGDGVMFMDYNRNLDGLEFQNFHTRDVAWYEDNAKNINEVHRKWMPTAIDLIRTFGEDSCSDEVKKFCADGKDCRKKVNCRHIMVRKDLYYGKIKEDFPYYSLYIDIDHKHVMEERGRHELGYVIPRWLMVSNHQYAYSLATLNIIGDTKMLNSMMLSMIEVAAKTADPPFAYAKEAIRDDINLMVGGEGIPYTIEGMANINKPIEYLETNGNGIAQGMNFVEFVEKKIRSGCFIDQLILPTTNGGMSPFEIEQRQKQYLNSVNSVFRHNQDGLEQACEMAFGMLLRKGAFGSPANIPKRLNNMDFRFNFQNPITQAYNNQVQMAFQKLSAIVSGAVQGDPAIAQLPKWELATRETASASNVKPDWLQDEGYMDNVRQQQQQQNQMVQAQQGVDIAQGAGKAAESFAGIYGG